jgi:hypothetical protein
MKRIVLICLFFVSLALFWACDKKENSSGLGRITVRLHDMPENFDSVIVQVTGVRVHVDDYGWLDLNTEEGLYDLLELQNGVDTTIVPYQAIPAGMISQIRLILGSQNHVYLAGTAYPLELSSQDESGLKLNVHQYLSEDQDVALILDFDVSQSILQNGNGSYRLKPVINAQFQ